jgi:nucleoside diphosphate-linked moiety X motif 19, mitochondrial
VYQTPAEESVPRSVSLRIAAIRETFEECGILLCRDQSLDRDTKYGNSMVLPREEMQRFAENADPNKFFELCTRLNYFPDVWSLTEARNWLTPAFFPKRFDTAFFLCCLDHVPPVEIDRTEISDYKVGFLCC